jgi:hypothetical protein
MFYWDRFGLNGLLYISISDIIKSAVQPILYSFGNAVIIQVFLNYGLELDKAFPSGGGQNTKVGKLLNSPKVNFVVKLIWVLAVVLLYYYQDEKNVWSFWVYLTACPIWLFLLSTPLFDKIENIRARSIIVQSMVLLPLFSLALGRRDSLLVYNNVRYKFALKHSYRNNKELIDTMKLIGVSSESLFFTDLHNSAYYMIGKKSDTLILYNKN